MGQAPAHFLTLGYGCRRGADVVRLAAHEFFLHWPAAPA